MYSLSSSTNQALIQKYFITAVEDGDLDAIQAIFEDYSKNININYEYKSTDGDRCTALYIAAQNGHTAVLNYLLSKEDIDISKKTALQGNTPLHIAALYGYTDIVRSLLESAQKTGQDILNTKRSSDGSTALHMAASKNHIEAVKLLLEAGADPNIKNNDDLTPLSISVANNHTKIGLLLDGSDQGLHSCIIQRMKALGFQACTKGICFGFTELVKHNALSPTEDLQNFYNMLFFLKKTKVSNLLLMKDFHDNLYLNVTKEALKELNADADPRDLGKIIDEKLRLRRKNFTKDEQEQEQRYIDILSLFTGIELGATGQKYQHLIENIKFKRVKSHQLFIKTKPEVGEFFVELSKRGSLLFKYWSYDGSIKTAKITQKEIKSILQAHYKEFTRALSEKNTTKIDTCLKIILKVVTNKGEVFLEQRKSTQGDNIQWVTPLIQSKFMEHKGGISQIASFTGIYTQEELSLYLKTLRMSLKENLKDNTPILFCLQSCNHSISFKYDNTQDTWEFFDVNQMPSSVEERGKNIFLGEQNLSDSIIKSFHAKNGSSLFQTCVFTTKDVATIAKKAIDTWKEEIQPLHKVTPEKALFQDQYNASWLWLACLLGDVETVHALLASGADVNAKNDRGTYPLMVAAQCGDIHIVRSLLKQASIKVNEPSAHNANAFDNAVQDGRTEIVKVLLKQKMIKERDLSVHLIVALQEGYSDIVTILLQRAMINSNATFNNVSPLTSAVKWGHQECLNILLNKKAKEIDPNYLDDGRTALCIAVENEYCDIVKVLLNKQFKTKIDLNQKFYGAPLLYHAVCKGNRDIAKALLNAGADVDAKDIKGQTPLFVAACNGNYEMVKLLLSYEAKTSDTEHFNSRELDSSKIVLEDNTTRGVYSPGMFHNHSNSKKPIEDELLCRCRLGLGPTQ